MGPDALISISNTTSSHEPDFVSIHICGTERPNDLQIVGKMSVEDFGKMMLGDAMLPIEITDLRVNGKER